MIAKIFIKLKFQLDCNFGPENYIEEDIFARVTCKSLRTQSSGKSVQMEENLITPQIRATFSLHSHLRRGLSSLPSMSSRTPYNCAKKQKRKNPQASRLKERNTGQRCANKTNCFVVVFSFQWL